MVTSIGGAGPAAPGGVSGPGEGHGADAVGQAGDSEPGGGIRRPPRDPGPGRSVGLVLAQPLGAGGDHHPGVQDVDQAAGD